MSRAEYGGNRAGMTYHGNDRQAEVEKIAELLNRIGGGYDSKIVAECLVNAGIRSKDGFEKDPYSHQMKAIDYKEEA